MADLTVFISYRRADSSADAGRLYDALRRRFGRENLFMDVDSLRPGEDWVDAVEGAVTRCDVLLAVIGPDWAGGADADGVTRIHKELDRVRLEIEAALRHNKPVIPVLVEGASMPTSADLPESLRALLRRHAIRVSHSTFESDLGALVRALRIIDRARPGRAAAMDREERDPSTLVVTPAPEPALPAPPPSSPTAGTTPPAGTAPTPTPSPAPMPASAAPFSASEAPPMPPTPPGPTPGYVPPAPLPPTPPQAAYTPPSTTPAYGYTQPAYGYGQPVARQSSGPSGVVIGAIALGTVLIVGVVLMAALGIGPFAGTAQVTSTPVRTNPPTTLPSVSAPASATPTVIPPTSTPSTAPATSAPPTISPAPATTAPTSDDFARLRALVPDDVEQYCEEDTSFGNRLFCFIDPLSASFWYELFPNEAALNDEYDGWLEFRNMERDVANCFDTPIPLPCEGEYQVGDIDPAGRVAGVLDGENGWMYWTHTPSGIFGEGLTSIDEDDTFEELFTYWADSASVLDYTPPEP